MSMSADKIISEARAKVIWGEPSLTVRDFLISNGVPEVVAEAKLKEFQFERSRELRKIGFRNVLIGGILTGAAGVPLVYKEPRKLAAARLAQQYALIRLWA